MSQSGHSEPDPRAKSRIGSLPSLVTLGNLMCGFAAIGVSAQAQLYWKAARPDPGRGFGSFALAGSLILLAMVFDALDGKIARMANLTSEFGAQLDSLCDMVSFGIAPAYIVFLEIASRDMLGHYSYAWVCAALYTVCVALRLARFNVETVPAGGVHLYFQGLPSPAAGGVIASLAIFEWRMPATAPWAASCMPFAAVILGGLMISRIRYAHVLNFLFSEWISFNYLAVLIFGVFTILALPVYYEYVLLAGFGGYVLSGPVAMGLRVARGKAPAEADDRAIF